MTEMVHVPPAPTLAPQLLVWAKSPLARMLEMLNVAAPVLVKVTAGGNTCDAQGRATCVCQGE